MSKASKTVGKVAGTNDIEHTQAKLRAEWKVDYYQKHHEIALDQLTGLSKWLTASLFTANSGGILTVLNQFEKVTSPREAALLFVSGLVFALLGAVANQNYSNKISRALPDAIFYWNEVKITGLTNSQRQNDIESSIHRTGERSWIGEVLGWLSGSMFVVGVIVFSISLA